jgi:hypothetical protein
MKNQASTRPALPRRERRRGSLVCTRNGFKQSASAFISAVVPPAARVAGSRWIDAERDRQAPPTARVLRPQERGWRAADRSTGIHRVVPGMRSGPSSYASWHRIIDEALTSHWHATIFRGTLCRQGSSSNSHAPLIAEQNTRWHNRSTRFP